MEHTDLSIAAAALSATTERRRRDFGRRACISGGVAVLLLAVIFGLSGLPELAVMNVGCAVIFALSYVTSERGQAPLAMGLAVAEILLNSTFTSWYLGWASGFHFYIFLVTPLLLSELTLSLRVRLVASLASVVWYIVMDRLLYAATPVVAIPGDALATFRWSNLAFVMALLANQMHQYVQSAVFAEERLDGLASKDPLTGLNNRRRLHEMVALLEPAKADGGASPHYSVILGDIDHFKVINDQHGHAAGDAVLQLVSKRFAEMVRRSDTVGRWGGEEFLVLLPDTSLEEAAALAERLRAAIADTHLAPIERAATVTLGVSMRRPGESFDACVARADEALYAGKRDGRNRVGVTASA